MTTHILKLTISLAFIVLLDNASKAQYIGTPNAALANSTDVKFTYNWNVNSNSWLQTNKFEYDYDSIGRDKEMRRYNFASYPLERVLYFYNAKNLLEKEIQYKYNTIKDSFENYRTLFYEYDSKDRINITTTEEWNKDSLKWKLNRRVTKLYDTRDNLIENKIEGIQANQFKLIVWYKYDFKYANDKLLQNSELIYNRNTSNFDTTEKIVYEYINDYQYEVSEYDMNDVFYPSGRKITKTIHQLDSNFKLKNIITYSGLNNTNTWELMSLLDSINLELSYDPNNQITSKYYSAVYKSWDSTSQSFVINFKYVMDSLTTEKKVVKKIFELNSGQWQNTSINIDTFDLYNNLMSYESYYIDSMGQRILQAADRYNYTYTNGSRYYDMFRESYNYENKNWSKATREIVSLFTGIATAKNVERLIKVYPNPNNGEFEIQFGSKPSTSEKIYIYNVYGRLVQSQSIDAQISKIKIAGLEPGLHFVKFRNYTEKVIVD